MEFKSSTLLLYYSVNTNKNPFMFWLESIAAISDQPCNCYRDQENLTLHWMCFFILTSASSCFCLLEGYCLYIMACLRELCSSAWMLNQTVFVQGNSLILFTVNGYWRTKLTHSLSEAGHSRRPLQDSWPFYFTTSSFSLFYKRTWHPDSDKMVILRH